MPAIFFLGGETSAAAHAVAVVGKYSLVLTNTKISGFLSPSFLRTSRTGRHHLRVTEPECRCFKQHLQMKWTRA